MQSLEEIRKTSLDALSSAETEADLEDWRVRHLGRKSPIMEVFAGLGALTAEERPAVGRQANEVRTMLESALDERLEEVRSVGL
jgi:phenylalanyl-tRNA synthetase alpha chain